MTPVLILALAKLIIPARSFSNLSIGQEFLELLKQPLLFIGTHILGRKEPPILYQFRYFLKILTLELVAMAVFSIKKTLILMSPVMLMSMVSHLEPFIP